MNSDKLKTQSAASAVVSSGSALSDVANAQGRYVAKCYDKDGNLKWVDTFDNLVTTVGGNDMLDKYLAGSAYTASFYMGLITATSYSAVALADTMSSHAGWLEAGGTNAPAYSQGARQTCSWSSASAKVKALSSPVSFSITSAGTIKGSFLTTSSTKDGTSGILFSAGLFSGGDKVVANGDTLNVSYQLGV